jgi:hydrogenase nickel incorporation protein HypA/HybF
MHELSIACSIVEMVEEHLESENSRVTKVMIQIGKMSGVVKDALLFSFEIAARETRVTGARLEIEELPVIVHCDKCNKNSQLETFPIFRCGYCREPTGNILQGQEMELVSMEIEDGQAANS